MNLSEHVRTLLHKAAQDEAVLAELPEDPQFDDETVGFHAQQAAEKLLKAWLSHLRVNYPKTHRLETLLDPLNASGVSVLSGIDSPRDLRPSRWLSVAMKLFSPIVDRWVSPAFGKRFQNEAQIGALASWGLWRLFHNGWAARCPGQAWGARQFLSWEH